MPLEFQFHFFQSCEAESGMESLSFEVTSLKHSHAVWCNTLVQYLAPYKGISYKRGYEKD